VSNIRKLKLSELDRSGLCQSRVKADTERLIEYKLVWEAEEAQFPPCIVYQDGDKYYVADGFHRIQSKMLARLETRQEQRTIECEVRQGTMQDAITYSLGANLRHGLRPNTADKKRAILLYYSLKPEHCAHSNNEVSKAVGCSHTFVGAWKATCISSPIDITFAETKIPMLVLEQTIENLIAAQAEGKIVTTRNGKLLEQKVSLKSPEAAVEEPLQMPLQELPISSKALPEPAFYIVTTTASIIPRGTVIEGWESLTDTGNITTDWEAGTVLIANEDLIEIPYPIDSQVTLIGKEYELTVTGYALVASDLKIKSIDKHGFAMTHSSEMLKPYIKKDDVEKSTPPILDLIGKLPLMPEGVEHLDLSILTTDQLRQIVNTIESEIIRRGA
jgi:hypothetical protein